MPRSSTVTIGLFGASCLLAGLHNLLYPSSGLASLDLPSGALPAVYGNALAATAMGLYYSLAAYQGNRMFYFLTVPMRILTATVFWSQGGPWKKAAIWEGGGAVLTGLALWWES